MLLLVLRRPWPTSWHAPPFLPFSHDVPRLLRTKPDCDAVCTIRTACPYDDLSQGQTDRSSVRCRFSP